VLWMDNYRHTQFIESVSGGVQFKEIALEAEKGGESLR
jgi:hypothetical protein